MVRPERARRAVVAQRNVRLVGDFEGEVPFPEYGINIQVLDRASRTACTTARTPRRTSSSSRGECLLLINGEERPLEQWDFVHSPAWTEHVFVGAGDGPCAILMVGARPEHEELRYPVEDVARKHDAGVETETSSGREAYAAFDRPTAGPYREGTLPG